MIVGYNNSLCLTKLYGKTINLHLFTAFSSYSCTLPYTYTHNLTQKAKDKKLRIGRKKRVLFNSMDIWLFVTVLFYIFPIINYMTVKGFACCRAVFICFFLCVFIYILAHHWVYSVYVFSFMLTWKHNQLYMCIC